jgi:hypothetical protein
MTDLATDKLVIIAAILYAARWQRRVPESDAEKRRIIADALIDARLIVAAVLTETDSPVTLPEPEQPPPSPGTIGRIADAKATRRRGQSGVRPATEA